MDSKTKTKYDKAKYTVKKWEKEFRNVSSRTPTKGDIRNAPSIIRQSYKTYWNLKTSILETTLSDVLLDENAKDCFNSSNETAEDNSLRAEVPVTGEDSVCFRPLCETTTTQPFSNCQEPEGNSELSFENIVAGSLGVWGEHLNKHKVAVAVPQRALETKSVSMQYAQKLFNPAKFKNFNKKNPRKPRVFQKSKSIESLPVVDKSDGPTFELFGQQAASPQHPLDDNFTKNKHKFALKCSFAGNAVSLLQRAFDQGPLTAVGREVDASWLDRVQDEGKKTESMSQDSGLELSEGLSANRTQCSDSDSEDLIYNSDSESRTASRSGLHLPFDCSNVQAAVALPLINFEAEQDTGFPAERAFHKLSVKPMSSKRLADSEDPKPAAKRLRTETHSGTLPGVAAVSIRRPIVVAATIKQDAAVVKKLALLEKKLQSGKANENFVSINIQKKVFVRGKKTGTFSKYKKQKWKQLKQENGGGPRGVLKCFKCGDVGHFSKACPSDKGLLPLEDYESDDDSAFLTLEQMAEDAKAAGDSVHGGRRKLTQMKVIAAQPIDEKAEKTISPDVVQPPYLLSDDGSVAGTPKEVFDVMAREFGHERFLDGQEMAVMRILSGQSTLVTLSTGSGKSLCYQLPAAIYSLHNPGCVALVISPLVSLMEDQVSGIGGWVRSACYHTYMTQKKRDKVLERLKARELSVLLLSPETLVSLEAGPGRQLLAVLPPIAFACIDEAHCLHQWCHNFRPSYLTITQVLRENLGVRTLLGLTATASSGTVGSLMTHLEIDPSDEGALIKDTPLPDNLTLSVSISHQEREKQEALVDLLVKGFFADSSSIIIYCTRRETCDKVAGYLRTALQTRSGDTTKGRLSLNAEVYHAGLTAGRRNQVQKAFMTGKLRIVVATVAFGMGINKSDINGVIHYSLPSTFENYVQEVGRAGRDRQPARCHLFLDSRNGDLGELRRHIYCDTIDRFVIRKLLQLVFLPCACEGSAACPKHEVAFPVDETVSFLDLPQDTISTLLAYLALHERKWIKTLPLAYTKCTVSSYKGPKHLKSVCRTCSPLGLVMAQRQSESSGAVTSLTFDIFDLARQISWDSGVLKRTIKQTEWTTENNRPVKSGIMVDFSSLGFRMLAPGNLPDEELDQALDILNTTVQSHERAKLKGLQAFYSALTNVAYDNIGDCTDDHETSKRSLALKSEIRQYFTDQTSVDKIELPSISLVDEGALTDDIRQLIANSKADHVLTGRTIARILHGIGSPNFPPLVWARTRFWRLHMNQDFNALCQLATKQLLLYR